MERKIDLNGFLENKQNFIPHLSIDSVIFGFHQDQLKVLLLRVHDSGVWSLSGGFVRMDEGIDPAALRILRERTGLENIYLEQYHTFGHEERSKNNTLADILDFGHTEEFRNSWLNKRFVSIGYYALVDFSKVNPTPDSFSDKAAWFDLKDLPPMIFDHRQMIDKALESLRANLDTKLVGFNLLPETFTMPELQSLYETVLGYPLRRNNFQRKMLSMDILERIEKLYTGAANKAPYLYKFKAPSVEIADEL